MHLEPELGNPVWNEGVPNHVLTTAPNAHLVLFSNLAGTREAYLELLVTNNEHIVSYLNNEVQVGIWYSGKDTAPGFGLTKSHQL